MFLEISLEVKVITHFFMLYKLLYFLDSSELIPKD